MAATAMEEEPDLILDLKCPECRKIFYIGLPDLRLLKKNNKKFYFSFVKSFFISLVFLSQNRLIGQNAEFFLINQYIHSILLSLAQASEEPILEIATISLMQLFINPFYSPIKEFFLISLRNKDACVLTETLSISFAFFAAQLVSNKCFRDLGVKFIHHANYLVRHFTAFYLAAGLIDNIANFFLYNLSVELFPTSFDKKFVGTGFVVQYLICMSLLFLTALNFSKKKEEVKPLSPERIQLLIQRERVLIFED